MSFRDYVADSSTRAWVTISTLVIPTSRPMVTFVTLLPAHLRLGALTMSRTFRTLALSAALLAVTAPAFASGPGGTNPPPTGTFMTTLYSFFSFLGL